MKKIIGVFIILFSLSILNVKASSWRFEWENSTVYVPVNSSIEDYKSKPVASLYKDNVLLTDADITYLRDGDWLYYLANVDTSKKGNYYVWYKAYENSKYKPGTCPGYKCKVTFIVYDDIAPTITVNSDIIRIRRGDSFNPLENIKAIDNYDDELTITNSKDYDLMSIGNYTINIYVTDSSNNKSQASYNLEVYDYDPPKITYLREGANIRLPLNSEFNISDYFKADDSVDGDLTAKIKCSEVIDTSIVKSYDCRFYVINSANLEASIDVIVSIINDKAPVINLTSKSITLDYKVDISSIDFKKYIANIEDYKVDYNFLTIRNDLKNEVGSYHVFYTYDNLTFKCDNVLEVKLLSSEKPIISVSDIELKENVKAELKDFITVTDESDSNVSNSLIIYDEEVDYQNAGTYYAEVYAINSSGLSATKRFKVEIISNSEFVNEIVSTSNSFLDNSDKIITIVLVLVIAVLVYLLIKRKKDKSV